MSSGHRRPSTTKRAGCGQGPRAPGKGPGALPLPTGMGMEECCIARLVKAQKVDSRAESVL